MYLCLRWAPEYSPASIFLPCGLFQSLKTHNLSREVPGWGTLSQGPRTLIVK